MQLVEFDDVNNRGSPESYSDDKIRVFPLLNFNWTRHILENTTDRAAIQFIANNYTVKSSQEEQDVEEELPSLAGILNITVKQSCYIGKVTFH